MSERPSRRYEPEDVAVQVEDFVREEIGGSAHLVASSLSAALVMPAVVRSPRLFKKLVLICPTGYGTLDRPSGRLGDVIYGLFLAPSSGIRSTTPSSPGGASATTSGAWPTTMPIS